MRALRVAAVAAVLSLLGLLVWDVVHSHGGKVAREVDRGQIVPAPSFSMSLVDGPGKVSLTSLRGKVVVLNFWASDCIPCKQEQKMLNAAARHWSKKGVVFLGIDEVDDVAGLHAERLGVAEPDHLDRVTATPQHVLRRPRF